MILQSSRHQDNLQDRSYIAVQKLINGTKVYQLGAPPERVLLNLPCVMHSVRALDSPLMTEVALNWGFAPAAQRLADKIIGAWPSAACRRQDNQYSTTMYPATMHDCFMHGALKPTTAG